MNLIIYTVLDCSRSQKALDMLHETALPFTHFEINTGQAHVEGTRYVPVSYVKERAPKAQQAPIIFNGRHYVGSLEELDSLLLHISPTEVKQ